MADMVFWKNLNEVPKNFRLLQGAKLTLDQINRIYKVDAINMAKKRRDGRLDPNYAKARKEFMEKNEVVSKGNIKFWMPKTGGEG